MKERKKEGIVVKTEYKRKLVHTYSPIYPLIYYRYFGIQQGEGRRAYCVIYRVSLISLGSEV